MMKRLRLSKLMDALAMIVLNSPGCKFRSRTILRLTLRQLRHPALPLVIALPLLMAGCVTTRPTLDPFALQTPVFDRQRLDLTAEYSREHYGNATSRLTAPRMIVVHYTAIPTLRDSLDFFRPALLDRQIREDIAGGGAVNVSAHYVIDRNGELYQLAPEDVICRHTIGFNHTAIGIENVAADAGALTDAQARATAALVSRIVARHPGIRYLVGHHEYRDSTLPHHRLLLEKAAGYRFTDKIDPGPAFMSKVRQLLKADYGIILEE